MNLYTLRVVLEILGAEDYGIFSVLSGIVILFTFLNGAMINSTQRFLNFALGRNDVEQARNVYSASLVIHALIAVIVVVLAQTVGLWFFHTWLNIPAERQPSAILVYHFSVISTAIGIVQVPYRATIIAYEKMSFFAMLSIVEAILRLGIVFLLPIILLDKLVIYAFLLFIAGLIVFLAHKVYCNRKFETARFRRFKDKTLLRQFLGFSGWTVFGGLAYAGRDQGISVLVNIFHGVKVNAAMGIAGQVGSAIYQFVGNFQTAFNPQIVKSYSADQASDSFIRLIFRTSKVSFCLLFVFVLPLYINADFVLQIWLNNVPEYAITFTRLTLLFSLIGAIAGPLWISIHATGNIKKYELVASCLAFANLPMSLLFLRMGFSPLWVLVIRIGLDTLLFVWRMLFLAGAVKFKIVDFFYEVIAPIFIIAIISIFVTMIFHNLFDGHWSRLIVSCFISTITIIIFTYLIGLNKQEKKMLRNWIKEKYHG